MQTDVGADQEGGRRIVIVTPGYPPSRGGVEEHVGALAPLIAARGWQVRVLTADRELRRRRVRTTAGVVVETYPAWRSRRLSVAPRLVLRALAVRRADVLHVHSYHAATGLAVLNPFLRGRIVFTPHFHGGGHSPVAVALHRVYRRLAGRLFSAAARVVCVSDAERGALLAGLSDRAATVSERVEVVPNGVQTAAIRAAEPWPDQPPTVVALGRVEAYKRLDVLLRALADVPPPVRLVIIGDGSQRPELAARAVELGLADRVVFTGAVPTGTVHRWLRTAAVLVSLSAHEAFGLVPVEAAAAGAAVVVSDIPAHREIVGRYLGDRARLVDGDAPAEVADALRAQLVRPRAEVDVPSWEAVAEATASIYDRIATRAASR